MNSGGPATSSSLAALGGGGLAASSMVIPATSRVTDLDAIMQNFDAKAAKDLRSCMTSTLTFVNAIADAGNLPIYELGQHVCSNVCVLVLEHYVKKMIAGLTAKSTQATARADVSAPFRSLLLAMHHGVPSGHVAPPLAWKQCRPFLLILNYVAGVLQSDSLSSRFGQDFCAILTFLLRFDVYRRVVPPTIIASLSQRCIQVCIAATSAATATGGRGDSPAAPTSLDADEPTAYAQLLESVVALPHWCTGWLAYPPLGDRGTCATEGEPHLISFCLDLATVLQAAHAVDKLESASLRAHTALMSALTSIVSMFECAGAGGALDDAGMAASVVRCHEVPVSNSDLADRPLSTAAAADDSGNVTTVTGSAAAGSKPSHAAVAAASAFVLEQRQQSSCCRRIPHGVAGSQQLSSAIAKLIVLGFGAWHVTARKDAWRMQLCLLTAAVMSRVVCEAGWLLLDRSCFRSEAELRAAPGAQWTPSLTSAIHETILPCLLAILGAGRCDFTSVTGRDLQVYPCPALEPFFTMASGVLCSAVATEGLHQQLRSDSGAGPPRGPAASGVPSASATSLTDALLTSVATALKSSATDDRRTSHIAATMWMHVIASPSDLHIARSPFVATSALLPSLAHLIVTEGAASRVAPRGGGSGGCPFMLPYCAAVAVLVPFLTKDDVEAVWLSVGLAAVTGSSSSSDYRGGVVSSSKEYMVNPPNATRYSLLSRVFTHVAFADRARLAISSLRLPGGLALSPHLQDHRSLVNLDVLYFLCRVCDASVRPSSPVQMDAASFLAALHEWPQQQIHRPEGGGGLPRLGMNDGTSLVDVFDRVVDAHGGATNAAALAPADRSPMSRLHCALIRGLISRDAAHATTIVSLLEVVRAASGFPFGPLGDPPAAAALFDSLSHDDSAASLTEQRFVLQLQRSMRILIVSSGGGADDVSGCLDGGEGSGGAPCRSTRGGATSFDRIDSMLSRLSADVDAEQSCDEGPGGVRRSDGRGQALLSGAWLAGANFSAIPPHAIAAATCAAALDVFAAFLQTNSGSLRSEGTTRGTTEFAADTSTTIAAVRMAHVVLVLLECGAWSVAEAAQQLHLAPGSSMGGPGTAWVWCADHPLFEEQRRGRATTGVATPDVKVASLLTWCMQLVDANFSRMGFGDARAVVGSLRTLLDDVGGVLLGPEVSLWDSARPGQALLSALGSICRRAHALAQRLLLWAPAQLASLDTLSVVAQLRSGALCVGAAFLAWFSRYNLRALASHDPLLNPSSALADVSATLSTLLLVGTDAAERPQPIAPHALTSIASLLRFIASIPLPDSTVPLLLELLRNVATRYNFSLTRVVADGLAGVVDVCLDRRFRSDSVAASYALLATRGIVRRGGPPVVVSGVDALAARFVAVEGVLGQIVNMLGRLTPAAPGIDAPGPQLFYESAFVVGSLIRALRVAWLGLVDTASQVVAANRAASTSSVLRLGSRPLESVHDVILRALFAACCGCCCTLNSVADCRGHVMPEVVATLIAVIADRAVLESPPSPTHWDHLQSWVNRCLGPCFLQGSGGAARSGNAHAADMAAACLSGVLMSAVNRRGRRNVSAEVDVLALAMETFGLGVGQAMVAPLQQGLAAASCRLRRLLPSLPNGGGVAALFPWGTALRRAFLARAEDVVYAWVHGFGHPIEALPVAKIGMLFPPDFEVGQGGTPQSVAVGQALLVPQSDLPPMSRDSRFTGAVVAACAASASRAEQWDGLLRCVHSSYRGEVLSSRAHGGESDTAALLTIAFPETYANLALAAAASPAARSSVGAPPDQHDVAQRSALGLEWMAVQLGSASMAAQLRMHLESVAMQMSRLTVVPDGTFSRDMSPPLLRGVAAMWRSMAPRSGAVGPPPHPVVEVDLEGTTTAACARLFDRATLETSSHSIRLPRVHWATMHAALSRVLNLATGDAAWFTSTATGANDAVALIARLVAEILTEEPRSAEQPVPCVTQHSSCCADAGGSAHGTAASAVSSKRGGSKRARAEAAGPATPPATSGASAAVSPEQLPHSSLACEADAPSFTGELSAMDPGHVVSRVRVAVALIASWVSPPSSSSPAARGRGGGGSEAASIFLRGGSPRAAAVLRRLLGRCVDRLTALLHASHVIRAEGHSAESEEHLGESDSAPLRWALAGAAATLWCTGLTGAVQSARKGATAAGGKANSQLARWLMGSFDEATGPWLRVLASAEYRGTTQLDADAGDSANWCLLVLLRTSCDAGGPSLLSSRRLQRVASAIARWEAHRRGGGLVDPREGPAAGVWERGLSQAFVAQLPTTAARELLPLSQVDAAESVPSPSGDVAAANAPALIDVDALDEEGADAPGAIGPVQLGPGATWLPPIASSLLDLVGADCSRVNGTEGATASASPFLVALPRPSNSHDAAATFAEWGRFLTQHEAALLQVCGNTTSWALRMARGVLVATFAAILSVLRASCGTTGVHVETVASRHGGDQDDDGSCRAAAVECLRVVVSLQAAAGLLPSQGLRLSGADGGDSASSSAAAKVTSTWVAAVARANNPLAAFMRHSSAALLEHVVGLAEDAVDEPRVMVLASAVLRHGAGGSKLSEFLIEASPSGAVSPSTAPGAPSPSIVDGLRTGDGHRFASSLLDRLACYKARSVTFNDHFVSSALSAAERRVRDTLTPRGGWNDPLLRTRFASDSTKGGGISRPATWLAIATYCCHVCESSALLSETYGPFLSLLALVPSFAAVLLPIFYVALAACRIGLMAGVVNAAGVAVFSRPVIEDAVATLDEMNVWLVSQILGDAAPLGNTTAAQLLCSLLDPVRAFMASVGRTSEPNNTRCLPLVGSLRALLSTTTLPSSALRPTAMATVEATAAPAEDVDRLIGFVAMAASSGNAARALMYAEIAAHCRGPRGGLLLLSDASGAAPELSSLLQQLSAGHQRPARMRQVVSSSLSAEDADRYRQRLQLALAPVLASHPGLITSPSSGDTRTTGDSAADAADLLSVDADLEVVTYSPRIAAVNVSAPFRQLLRLGGVVTARAVIRGLLSSHRLSLLSSSSMIAPLSTSERVTLQLEQLEAEAVWRMGRFDLPTAVGTVETPFLERARLSSLQCGRGRPAALQAAGPEDRHAWIVEATRRLLQLRQQRQQPPSPSGYRNEAAASALRGLIRSSRLHIARWLHEGRFSASLSQLLEVCAAAQMFTDVACLVASWTASTRPIHGGTVATVEPFSWLTQRDVVRSAQDEVPSQLSEARDLFRLNLTYEFAERAAESTAFAIDVARRARQDGRHVDAIRALQGARAHLRRISPGAPCDGTLDLALVTALAESNWDRGSAIHRAAAYSSLKAFVDTQSVCPHPAVLSRAGRRLVQWSYELGRLPASTLVRDVLPGLVDADNSGRSHFTLGTMADALYRDLVDRITSNKFSDYRRSLESSRKAQDELKRQLQANAAQLTESDKKLLQSRLHGAERDLRREEEERARVADDVSRYRHQAMHAFLRFLTASSSISAQRQQPHPPTAPSSGVARRGGAATDSATAPRRLPNCLEAAIAEGDDASSMHAVFRFCSLWLTGETDVAGASSSRSGSNDLSEDLVALLDGIPSRLFLPLSQLLCVKACQLGPAAPALTNLVLRLCADHPHGAAWHLITLANGDKFSSAEGSVHVVDQGKCEAAKALWGKLRAPHVHSPLRDAGGGSSSSHPPVFAGSVGSARSGGGGAASAASTGLKRVMDEMTLLADAYVQLAFQQTGDRGKESRKTLKLTSAAKIQQVRQLTMTPVITLPRTSDGAVVGFDAPDWLTPPEGTAFARVPTVHEFRPVVQLVGGVNAPKLVYCVGSDGREYKQLVKSSDDLRQDSLIQQVFALCNERLRREEPTRIANLSIRTYVVVPLSPTTGVVEWLDDTTTLDAYLVGSTSTDAARASCHARYGQPHELTNEECRVELDEVSKNGTAAKIAAFRSVCERFTPLLHCFFFDHFATPQQWSCARAAYVRSVATCCILGYIAGLGDRHAFNLLLDRQSAELIHIDLGLAFDQGARLPIPERVPFRLTRELVDGLGIFGTEGPFRQHCEVVMALARRHKALLSTVIEPYVHDPQARWAVDFASVDAARRAAGGGGAQSDHTHRQKQHRADAERAVARVGDKLSGYEGGEILGVAGQVQKLIQVATSEDVLALMYPGWSPWL